MSSKSCHFHCAFLLFKNKLLWWPMLYVLFKFVVALQGGTKVHSKFLKSKRLQWKKIRTSWQCAIVLSSSREQALFPFASFQIVIKIIFISSFIHSSKSNSYALSCMHTLYIFIFMLSSLTLFSSYSLWHFY